MQQKWKQLNWLFQQTEICSHIDLHSESVLQQLTWTNGTGWKEGEGHKRSVKSPVQTLVIRRSHGDLESDSDIGNAVLSDGYKTRKAVFWFIQRFIYQPCHKSAYLGLCLLSQTALSEVGPSSTSQQSSGDQTPAQLDTIPHDSASLPHKLMNLKLKVLVLLSGVLSNLNDWLQLPVVARRFMLPNVSRPFIFSGCRLTID